MDVSTARMILDVEADATESDVKQAFRQQVKNEHPDQSNSNDATERIKRVQEAKDVLLDDLSDEVNSDTQRSQNTGTSTSQTTNSSQSHSQSQTNSTSTASSAGTNKTEQETSHAGSHRSRSESEANKKTRNSTTADNRESTTAQADGGYSTISEEAVSDPHTPPTTGLFSLPAQPTLLVGLFSLAYISAFTALIAVQMGVGIPVLSELGILTQFLIWLTTSVLLGVSLRYDGVDRFGGWSEGLIAAVWPFVALVGFLLIQARYGQETIGLIPLITFIYFPALGGLFSVFHQSFNPF